MPQSCTICCHEARAAIDAALVAGNVPNRRIAAQHGLAEPAVRRHEAAHLPRRLAQAERARDVADADSLLTKADRLLRVAEHILATTLRAGDHRSALAAVREAPIPPATLAPLFSLRPTCMTPSPLSGGSICPTEFMRGDLPCRESSPRMVSETWVHGAHGGERAAIFKQFCSGYRIYRHPKENKVALVWENADLQKLEAVLTHPDTEKAKSRHTVLEPIEIHVEAEGGR